MTGTLPVFLPQFARPGPSAPTDLAILGAVYIFIEFATASGYALAGSRLKALRLGQTRARWLNRISASFMAAAAGWLATMRQHAS